MNGWVEDTILKAFTFCFPLAHIKDGIAAPNQKKVSMAKDETDYEKGALWSKVVVKSSLNSQ